MLIILLVTLFDNPFKGCYSGDAESPYMLYCFYYIVTVGWFAVTMMNRKEHTGICIFGIAAGFLGIISMLIQNTTDLPQDYYYYGHVESSANLYLAWGLAFAAHMSYIAVIGMLWGKNKNDKKARYSLVAILASMLLLFLSENLPLYDVSTEYSNESQYLSAFYSYADTREKFTLITYALLFGSWTAMMLLFKQSQSEKDEAASPAPAPAPTPVSSAVPQQAEVNAPVPPTPPVPPPVPQQAAATPPAAPVPPPVPPVPPPVPPVAQSVPPVPPPVPGVDCGDETVLEFASDGTATSQAGALTPGTTLQFGRYQIDSILGQGGFGITYLATQTGLNRKVAIKEFFMKEYCDRDITSNYITLGTAGSKEMVARFMAKFTKEAQTIAELQNQHVVRIYDTFNENGTAYYVMEYIEGGSLSQRVTGCPVDEATAYAYMNQICDALQYIHNRNILHLDIKPGNILFRSDNELVLIDFGVAKHYDEEGGSQTSSTPIGISRGYAPLEQYNRGGITQFSPATDIYSLGATFYTMVTGQVPPVANEIYEDGLHGFPETVSEKTMNAIIKAMNPRRKDRPQSIEEFKTLIAE